MNGEKISDLAKYETGELINDVNLGTTRTKITPEQALNTENKFEIKANGNTIATLDNPGK